MILVTEQVDFTAKASWGMVKSNFVVPVQILWWFWYQISRKYLHCLYEIISDILSHWLLAVEWRSVSATRLKILVGHMSSTDHSSTNICFYICLFSSHCTGSQFLEFVRPQVWLQFWVVILFFSAFSCYEQPVVFLLRHSISQSSSFVFFSEFCMQMIVLFSRRINTKDFIFLVSLWFLSPSAVICNLLCLSTKVLNPVASP